MRNTKVITICLLLFLSLSFMSIHPVYCEPTYTVTVNAVYETEANNSTISVPIMLDGVATGLETPHTFAGLIGQHNFTLPILDSDGHSLNRWVFNGGQAKFQVNNVLVSSKGTLYGYYHTFNKTAHNMYENTFFVTPSDPAVVSAAGDKSWNEIIDWVASHISYNYTEGQANQFPNETLAVGTGQCRDYANLCASMLISRGYTAYSTVGKVSAITGMDIARWGTGHQWLVLKLDGTFYHIEPQRTLARQPTATQWTGYTEQEFIDNLGIYDVQPCMDPPPVITPTPAPTPTLSPTLTATPTQAPTSNPTSNPTVQPTLTPTPTNSSTTQPTTEPTEIPTNTPTPSPSVPEIPSRTVLLLMLSSLGLAIILSKKRRSPPVSLFSS